MNTHITPKDFFLWAAAMITLYASVFAFLALVFDYINYAFPDPLEYFPVDPYSGGVSYEMASLIVLFPIFLVTMRMIHRDIERDATRREIWVRRWALYLTLFVAGATIAGDLITLVMYFFNGEISMRFILKIVLVFLVAGAGFLHFLADLGNYWERNPSRARMVGWAAGVLALLTVVAGFFVIGTPWQARQYRLDEQRVSDLQSIQAQIVNFWQAKEKLPASLGALNDQISGYTVPVDPASGAAYTYKPGEGLSFQLCAIFDAESQEYGDQKALVAPTGPYGSTPENWKHGAGEQCFERTIDPQLYPPFSKTRPQ